MLFSSSPTADVHFGGSSFKLVFPSGKDKACHDIAIYDIEVKKDRIFNVTLSETVSINVPKATIVTGDDTTVLITNCKCMCENVNGCVLYW